MGRSKEVLGPPSQICHLKCQSCSHAHCLLRYKARANISSENLVRMTQPSDYWKKFSPEELQLQYSPTRWQQRLEPAIVVTEHINFSTEASKRAKENVPCQLGQQYGNSDRARVDIFGADALPKDAPILFYVHGGYWQQLDREIVSCFVETFYNAGVIVAVVGYDLAPNVKLDEIVEEIRSALIFMLNIAEERKSRGIFLCGWSAGAQLISMGAILSAQTISSSKVRYLKGFIFISGIFDLRPLETTDINIALQLTEQQLIRNSPMYHVEEFVDYFKNTRCLLAVGQYDPPEFQRQSAQYHQVLLRGGIHSKYIITAGEDHFTIIENLSNSHLALTQEMLKIITDPCSA